MKCLYLNSFIKLDSLYEKYYQIVMTPTTCLREFFFKFIILSQEKVFSNLFMCCLFLFDEREW